ncbi:MAG: zincin-like metallopeptidase domain-containing protein [Planctomycetota bacterium]|jgi:antirestriction protein ArdC
MSPKLSQKAKVQLESLLELFRSGNVPDAVAIAVIPPLDIPSAKWSLTNRILTLLADTADARGIRQWNEVGRKVQKGSRAFYILGPSIVKKTDTDGETGEDTEKSVLVGFHAIPVFRVEDTHGEPIDYPETEPPQPPPLSEVAKTWDIEVQYIPFTGRYYGYTWHDKDQIALCTHDETVFFHELTHQAHRRVLSANNGKMNTGQDPKQEIVAELSAAVLARLHGRQLPNEGRHYRYIESYADKMKKDVYRACMSVLADVEKVLGLILGTTSPSETKGVAA